MLMWSRLRTAPRRISTPLRKQVYWCNARRWGAGHCLISGEDAGAVVRRAGGRLGYVHLDDNDGAGDLHWPLLTGRLTRRDLEGLAAALREVNYCGGVALELNAAHGDAVPGLR